MAEDWQTQKFRQNVIAKINELLQTSGQDPSKNAGVMENHIFKKARNKDEYLGLVAKLYMHFKDLAQRKPQQPPPPNADMSQQNMMQDPLNALQTLASQGNRNPQMMPMPGGPNPNQMGGGGPGGPGGPVAASNLLQTLNQQRPGQQMQQMQGIRGPMQQMGPHGGGGMQIMSGGQQPQMSQMGAGGPSGTPGGPGGGPSGPPNQMQLGSGQMQGGPMSVNAMNVQQMPQMQQMNQQQQMAMGMNHSQMNQMMNARMNQGGPMNVVGPNAGMPSSIQPNQGGPMHPSSVGGPQGAPVSAAGMPPNAGQQPGNLNQMLSMQQKPNMPQGGQMFPGNRGVPGQPQFLRQSPSPSTVPSPAAAQQLQQQQQQLQQIQQQQQACTPNQQPQPPPPQPQLIASPAMLPTASPQMSGHMQGNQQRQPRQSPSATLNTPGQVNSNSPFNPQEDQLYREKYKQLTKYIEPLKRMVAKIGNDGANTEKITKMSKLLEILSNPTQRVPLETLLKCEKALEKMEIVNNSGQQFGKSSNPLMEVLITTLQSPLANHTLYRTFRPTLDLLYGTDISAPVPAKKQRLRVDRPPPFDSDIPHDLQGEIARIDQKFKVTVDRTFKNNNKAVRVVCCLDDRRLPNVPPIIVTIPEDYPYVSPECTLSTVDYQATPFMRSVQTALVARIAKLPICYSLSHLLDTWEMAVRQASSPNMKPTCDFTALFGV